MNYNAFIDAVMKGIWMTVCTYSLLIHALFMEGKHEAAKGLMKEMVPDAIAYNILINGYSKEGECEEGI